MEQLACERAYVQIQSPYLLQRRTTIWLVLFGGCPIDDSESNHFLQYPTTKSDSLTRSRTNRDVGGRSEDFTEGLCQRSTILCTTTTDQSTRRQPSLRTGRRLCEPNKNRSNQSLNILLQDCLCLDRTQSSHHLSCGSTSAHTNTGEPI